MRAIRPLTILFISGTLVLAALFDRSRGVITVLPAASASSVSFAAAGGSTWFCPGGSGGTGLARVGVEVVNAGSVPIQVAITAMGSKPSSDPVAGTIAVGAGGRTVVALETMIPDDPWVGAVVETSNPDVIVDQLFDGPTGTDRSPCITGTAGSWVVPNGATRIESDGEQMILLLLNPFPDDAVVDIDFDADVGLDSMSGVVVPANRVTAVDVTNEVTVAGRVSAIIDVVAGRLAVSRIQTYDSDVARGLSVETASPGGSPVTYLPNVGLADGRTDVLSVTNPSKDEIAQVDVEIVAKTDVPLDPIELTVHPRRTVTIRLPDEPRLAGLTTFSLVVRSLSGVPVAASLDSLVAPGGDNVVGAAAETGADVASQDWLVPIEATDAGSADVVVVNPSMVAVAEVAFSVIGPDGTTDISTVELGPARRTSVMTPELGGSQAVLRVVASSPVVVGAESAGLTSRSMSIGIRTGKAVPFSEVP